MSIGTESSETLTIGMIFLIPFGQSQVYTNFEFYDCKFVWSRLSQTRNPNRRSHVKDAKVVNCVQEDCGLDAAILENLVVENLRCATPLTCWATVFKHVQIKGKIGQMVFSRAVLSTFATPKQQAAFDKANEAFYETVDWALDITEAEFEEVRIHSVPPHLIRRDKETQFIITREKALQRKWEEIDLSGTFWPSYIEVFLAEGTLAEVLVAPKAHPRFKHLLEGLYKLRDIGLLEES